MLLQDLNHALKALSMKISIVTLFPELYKPFLATSLLERSQEKGLVSFGITNLFELCAPKERIDSPPYGHGTGMLIKPEIIQKAVESIESSSGPAYKIFFSPRGKKLDQDLLKELYENIQKKGHVALFPARYEGMDARVEEYYADSIISIGDYVLMGGDLPAMVFLEGLLRLHPAIVGKTESVARDSFSGAFVDFPSYTPPLVWKNMVVPEVLRSGNHQAVDRWREERAVHDTIYNHFEWLRNHEVMQHERDLIKKMMPKHYAVLMHDQVMLPTGEEGTTSVTSLDIHDIARSAKTYNLEHYFLVTPLLDQQKIVQTLLDFWKIGEGVTYNPSRHEAVSSVSWKASFNEVVQEIERREGKRPVLIATSARGSEFPEKLITYFDQQKVWSEERPILFIFGTGQGLGQSIINCVDYILLPLKGYSDFNHLSVRSAAAIIFDRWLGMNVRRITKKHTI
jgi:tRNA (guanine37-N1)-methyltransferase